MKSQVTADIVIFGGGIAGLWTLNRLRQAGFHAILFETNALGSGQTNKSQGIIHGGMKYALQGVLTNDAKAVADMPSVWQACLDGKGEIDLAKVGVLSKHQLLWSPNKFTAKLTGLLASATLSSKVDPIHKDTHPAVFQHARFKGEVYKLDEMVLDVPSVVRELAMPHQDAIFKIDALARDALHFAANGDLESITVSHDGQSLSVHAQQFVFAAGSGNELAIEQSNTNNVAMQRRPLHMVMVKTPFHLPLYAHCLGLGSRPRLTITTHYLKDGSPVWYLGGMIAEDGVNKDSAEQINAAKKELTSIFPWLNFSKAAFSTFMIDRAEPKQHNGLKPETTFSSTMGNLLISWPTKLALAPKLASEIEAYFASINLKPKPVDLIALQNWPKPEVATPVWEEAFC